MALINQKISDPKTNLTDVELEYLFNYLLDKEVPATSLELAQTLQNRGKNDSSADIKRKFDAGQIYQPGRSYKVGDNISVPQHAWLEGKVTEVRAGVNPELGDFQVITLKDSDGNHKQFAASLVEHPINELTIDDYIGMVEIDDSKDLTLLKRKVDTTFTENEDLVQISGAWFPRSLLIDINPGYLNLAEAVLEMSEGGPLTTKSILDQIELTKTGNPKLLEFSMNLALQEDDRFDEVGPSGETLWFLKRLEPALVQEIPPLLKYQAPQGFPEPPEDILIELENLIYDDLEPGTAESTGSKVIEINLIFPHLMSGTLPLTPDMGNLFPSAYEAPRVNFTFVDEDSGKEFTGWVVRPHHYVYGLKEWYQEKDLIPGSIVYLQKGKNPGQVSIKAGKIKPTKDWFKTVLIGADGGAVITLLKQPVSSKVDERMAYIIPNPAATEKLWTKNSSSHSFIERGVFDVLKQLMKLSPQGNVHALELYAGVNIFQRVPPRVIMSILVNDPRINYLGNLHFRFSDDGLGA